MKRNGRLRQKGREFALDVAFLTEWRSAPKPLRFSFRALLRRWFKRPPQREFWELDVETGEWKRI